MTILLIGIGLALRVWQYLANSSLWIDEAALARNIIDRPVTALFGGLDYAQVAPPGFLLIQKAIVATMGSSEYALRLIPLLGGIGGLVLFARLAGDLLEGWAAPFAVGLFALGTPFIYFSSQVKQYSTDVAVALLLLFAALEIRRRGVTRQRACWLGIVGAVTVWFSQPALFVLAGIGAGLVILVLMERDRAAARTFMITWTLWGLSAGAVAVFSLLTVSAIDREYFHWFWAAGFMPMPPRRVSDAAWLFNKLTWAFGAFEEGLGRTNGGLNYRWSYVFTVVMLSGYWALWRSRRDVALFLLLPVVVVAALSAAAVYPFTARLLAFLVPSLLLATAAGAGSLLSAWPRRLQFLVPVGLAVLGGAPIYAAATALPPFWLQHLRPVIERVQARREPTDAIYVYYGAGQAFRYYAPRYGIRPADVVIGRCALGNPRAYLRELDQFRGRRVWILVTHAQRNGLEPAFMLEYLDSIGRRLETVTSPASSGRPVEEASGYLYDLSDRDRLASAVSNTYPIASGPLTGSSVWRCYGVTGSEPERSARSSRSGP